MVKPRATIARSMFEDLTEQNNDEPCALKILRKMKTARTEHFNECGQSYNYVSRLRDIKSILGTIDQ